MNELMQLWDQHPVEALAIFVFICWLIGRWRRQMAREAVAPAYNPETSRNPASSCGTPYKPNQGGLLDCILWYWGGNRKEPFSIRDLLRSIFCCGGSGSGKTTDSGYFIGSALAKFGRKISLLILASKPEDPDF